MDAMSAWEIGHFFEAIGAVAAIMCPSQCSPYDDRVTYYNNFHQVEKSNNFAKVRWLKSGLPHYIAMNVQLFGKTVNVNSHGCPLQVFYPFFAALGKYYGTKKKA